MNPHHKMKIDVWLPLEARCPHGWLASAKQCPHCADLEVYAEKDRRKTREYNLLVEENRALLADKKRMDWIAANSEWHPPAPWRDGFSHIVEFYFNEVPQSDLRAAIDATMDAQAKEKGK